MSCYKPLKAFRTPTGAVFSELGRHDILGDLELPCGQCIGCRMRRASDWSLRVMHEASMHDASCFVTLTYGRDCLPPNGSLEHRDFQLFMKRVRKHFGFSVRFYMCGEYGPLNKRPHYHACLFGVDFRSDRVQAGKSGSGSVFFDSPLLAHLWGHGKVSVQDLTRETAGYCARYIMKKVLGKASEAAYVTADGVAIRPEYAAMSLKPGIGASWFYKFGTDVYPHDYVVADGTKFAPPKYYDRLLRRIRSIELDTTLDDIEFARYERAVKAAPDNTEERRQVRAVVHEARLRNHKRGLE